MSSYCPFFAQIRSQDVILSIDETNPFLRELESMFGIRFGQINPLLGFTF